VANCRFPGEHRFHVVWLPLDVCGSRPLLASEWHACSQPFPREARRRIIRA
jgi:hypothetical protein